MERVQVPANERVVEGLQRRILVVEDSDAIRVLLVAGLRSVGFAAVGVRDAKQAIAELEDFDPDAAIVDVDLGRRPNGVELSRLLVEKAPHIGIVFLTSFVNPPGLEEGVLGDRPFGFILKSDLESIETLLGVLDSVLRGDLTQERTSKRAQLRPLDRLTPVQIEVLQMVAAGYSNQKIALDRACTIRSVERVLDRIYALLELEGMDETNLRVLAAQAFSREFGFPGTHRGAD